METSKANGDVVSDQFRDVTKLIEHGSGGKVYIPKSFTRTLSIRPYTPYGSITKENNE